MFRDIRYTPARDRRAAREGNGPGERVGMGWKTTNVQQQRVEFVVTANRREHSFGQLCAAAGISRPTGYRWLRRFQSQGLAGMEEDSRRPRHSPQRTPVAVEERVVAMRRERPDWGARKMACVLREQGVCLPVSTVHRIFLRYDLVREVDRRGRAEKRFERERPNELWQMDFKGPKGWDQPVGPLSVLDDHSRYVLALENTGSTRAEPVRAVLERVFAESGVPEAMLMDHGTPWFNTQGRLGWSQFTVWLMDQDVALLFSGIGHPQTQGKVERFHRTLTAALLRRGCPKEGHRQAWLDDYKYEYNHVRPHEALRMRKPGEVWHKSPRSYGPSRPRWSYPMGSLVNEVDRFGYTRWEGRRHYISKALAGREVGLLSVEQRTLAYYRRTLVCEIDPAQPADPRAGV